MNVIGFIEGPLLWSVFIMLGAGLLIRIVLFFYEALKRPKTILFLAPFFPLYRLLIKKPIYTISRYLFHACLFVVPIWYSGHINLWEESRFAWYWTPMPDVWSDWMTLVAIGFCVGFLIRRLILPNTRQNSRLSDYILVFATALPFLSGYFFTSGTLDNIPFFLNYLQTIHIFTAEVFMILIVFLSLKSRLNEKRCIGCSACELRCPADALTCEDKEKHRVFSYFQRRCIYCGWCVETCPEKAVEFFHNISIRPFSPRLIKEEVRTVLLSVCKKCGIPFAPTPQLDKIREAFPEDYVRLCQRCKGMVFAGQANIQNKEDI
ncbi:MAG: 4Fe-4S binding protein [Deltaproteobacteria bacterium]|nr:4Fe-4S binding protein [Deltaproteobacteria bacterium]